jgi:hypothetical protein
MPAKCWYSNAIVNCQLWRNLGLIVSHRLIVRWTSTIVLYWLYCIVYKSFKIEICTAFCQGYETWHLSNDPYQIWDVNVSCVTIHCSLYIIVCVQLCCLHRWWPACGVQEATSKRLFCQRCSLHKFTHNHYPPCIVGSTSGFFKQTKMSAPEASLPDSGSHSQWDLRTLIPHHKKESKLHASKSENWGSLQWYCENLSM